MKKLIMLVLFTICSIGCANCGNREPNIRTEPGIEFCGDMCSNLASLKCTGYYEDVQMPLSDGGVETLNCKQFCEYEMNNSVQLNPVCIKDVKTCGEIVEKCGG